MKESEEIKALSTEHLISGGLSRYSLIVGISKRAREISDRNESEGIQSDEKPVLLAAEEFARHEYDIVELPDEALEALKQARENKPPIYPVSGN